MVVALGVAALAAGCSSDTPAPAPPPVISPARPVAELPLTPIAGRREVLVVGGPFMAEVYQALAAATSTAPYVKLTDMTRSYAELRPINLDLASAWQADLDQYRPAVVIAHLVFTAPLFQCQGTPEKRASCESEGYKLAFTVALSELYEQLSSEGAHVVWIGYPPLFKGRGPAVERSVVYNEIADKFAQSHADFTYIDLGTALAPEGNYASYLPEIGGAFRQARMPDGYQLCPHGAALVADQVAAVMVPDWEPNITASWVEGPWRLDPAFSDQTVTGLTGPPCDDTRSIEVKTITHLDLGRYTGDPIG